MHRRSFLFAAAALAAMLGASAGAQAAEPIKVSASFSILGDMVKEVSVIIRRSVAAAARAPPCSTSSMWAV